MKSIRFLCLLLLLFCAVCALASCDMIDKVFPGGLPFLPKDTTAEVTTTADPATTTAAVTTTAVTTTAAVTTTEAPVTTTASIIPQKTPAEIDAPRFTSVISAYTVGYEADTQAAAAALADALSIPSGEYTESKDRAIHLMIESDGIIPLGAGDYHIYISREDIVIRGGDADGLSAAVTAFLATVKSGVTSQSRYVHTVYRAQPPVDVETVATNYADMTELYGTTVEDPLTYKAGDEIIFVLYLKTNGAPSGCTTFEWCVEADDYDGSFSGEVSGASGVFAFTVPFEMTLIPGTVRLSVDAFDAKGGLLPSIYSGTAAQPNVTWEITRPDYSYVGGAFIDADKITSDVLRTDEDFVAYWTERLEEIKAVKPTRSVGRNAKYHNGFGIYQLDADMLVALGYSDYVKYLDRYDMFEVYLCADSDRTDGRPAVGYLTVPKNAAADSLPLGIRLNAYGSRDGYLSVSSGTILLSMHPCGLPKGTFDASGKYTATDFSIVSGYGKIVEHYENPATDSEYTKMFMRNIQMLRFLTNEEYHDDLDDAATNMTSFAAFEALLAAYNGNINFWYGGSNGGFQNIATASLLLWEVDGARLVNGTLTEVIVGCPSMCDAVAYAGRTGRFESVQGGDIWADNGKVLNILNYALYDTVHFASFITEGTLKIQAGFGDVTSPAAGIMALYNAAKIEKELIFTQNKDHSGKNPETMVSTTISAPAAE